jgi:hypothetical protein
MVRLGVSANGLTTEEKSHRLCGGWAVDVEGEDAADCASVSSPSRDELQPGIETAARSKSSATSVTDPSGRR